MSTEIKSTTAVKHALESSPVQFSELAHETNLNSPPPNWLRGQFAEKEPWIPSHASSSKGSSFAMANSFLDCVGQVDVLTDAENVKKLLKLTYSEAPISLTVHRVGRTLLIDNFESYRHVLKAQETDWKWLKTFIRETLPIQDQNALVPVVAPRRKELEEKLMLSKFLFHSIGNNVRHADFALADKEFEKTELQLSPARLPDPLEDENDTYSKKGPQYERNILWTFEDIRMLIGTNMPIFGCGKQPCVSLKLRDMKKPINILTGLDYWLDQLMCNVPEVMMCYHLNGIVQKYELVKTADLPKMTDSQFSPELVRDVAQNILSFLKNNATKEGHTYWLFKGENDEVVKLYDLSSLCDSYVEAQDANPFSLPVAVLMYRVAKSLMQHSQQQPRRTANTVYRLLNNCLELLSKDKYPQIVGSVHYLLANLYLSYGTGAAQDKENAEKHLDEFTDPLDTSDEWATEESWQGVLSGETSSCVSVDVLKRRNSCGTEAAAPSGRRPLPNCTNLDACCKQALENVFEGLEAAEVFVREHRDVDAAESQPQSANPKDPIPLKYEPLKKLDARIIPAALRKPLTSTWQTELTSLLLVRASSAYQLLAECSLSLGHFGKCLGQIRLAFLCLESVLSLVRNVEDPSNTLRRSRVVIKMLIPSCFAKCGEAYLSLGGVAQDMLPKHELELEKFHFRDSTIVGKARKILKKEDRETENFWATARIPRGTCEILELSIKCYKAALSRCFQSKSEQEVKNLQLFVTSLLVDSKGLSRNLGNVMNEFGTYFTKIATNMVNGGSIPEFLKKDAPVVAVEQTSFIIQKGLDAFQEGIKLFRSAEDKANEALLYSNCGRLKRLEAHQMQSASLEVSAKERQLMNKAVDFYLRGLECVNPGRADNAWEMVAAELAGTYTSQAILLQDRPPLSSHSMEEIEREIGDYMQKALRLYETMQELHKDTAMAKHSLCRSFEIHSRLASLYHKLSREKEDFNGRRAKNLRNLTELHYSKAAETYGRLTLHGGSFRSVERSLGFLRVQLEHVAFCEYVLSGVSSVCGKQKILSQIVSLLTEGCGEDLKHLSENLAALGVPCSSHKDKSVLPDAEEEENDSLRETETLGKLFLERMQCAAKAGLHLAVNASKKSKGNDASLDWWKKVYAGTLVEAPTHTNEYPAVLRNVCDKISSLSVSTAVIAK